ncbi:chemotaxis protein CheA [Sphingomonas sp. MMS24-J13]|uniref:chemotaxis protein CheA n=1 Tax=Sphingomonas sp. MMS24-J13 TaxID=3238686 RepID=UPI00384CF556
MDDLLSDFIAETRETHDAIAGEIVAWEADPSDRARLDAIFRFVHTVKGSSGFLDLPRLERLSHAAEGALAEVREGRRLPDTALVSAVLAVIDRIAELTDAMASGDPLPDGEETFLIAALADGAVPVRMPLLGAPQPNRGVVRSIRLPVELLDRMMVGVSDMVLARNELSRRLREMGGNSPADAAFERLSQCVGDMRETITRTRMSRMDTLFVAIPRLARDLASELGKQIELEIDGGDVELDREMIEMIRDSLLHMVRNALDHGIEAPAARLRAGKNATGRLAITAHQSGNQILIDIVDDGAGIDTDRLTQKAIAAGIVTPAEVLGMNPARKLDLIFAPGLSTAARITAISGRGVGMDVVRANIERIGGTVEIQNRPGQGVKFSLRLPLTLTIIPALTISSAGHHFAIPRSAIDEIVRPRGDIAWIERLGGGLIAHIRGLRLPVVDLAAFMALPDPADLPDLLVVVRSREGQRYALGVDAVHDHEELVVKPAAPAVMASGIYAGATLPDNSRPILLLDAGGIATAAGVPVFPEEPVAAIEDAVPTLPTLLFRDLDGVMRGARLDVVERIEDVPIAGVVTAGGTLLISHGGRLASLYAAGALTPGDRVRVLRLTTSPAHFAYAIDQVVDVVPMPAELVPARTAGPVAGVTLYNGDPVEILDPFWLSAQATRDLPRPGRAPLCQVTDADDPWAHEVLAPLLRRAGYRVAFAGEPLDEPVAIILTTADVPAAADVPVVRLRADPEPDTDDSDSVYRDDRDALLFALGSKVARR